MPGEPGDQSGDIGSAGEQLKKAGERIAEAGNQLPGKSGDPRDNDPLVPDGPYDSDTYREGDEISDVPPGTGDESSEIEAEIQAAQEALEQAGIALQRAGEQLEDAESSGDLAAAEIALNDARVAVIIAGQDLNDLEGLLEGTEYEPLIDEAGEMLGDANLVIVAATDLILAGRIDLPEFEQQQAGAGLENETSSELEDELNASIVVFENQILEARADVLGSAPPPTTSENIPGVAVIGGQGKDREITFEENTIETGDADIFSEKGQMPDGEVAAVEKEGAALIPEDIPDPQGDDIVAQQLREAATAETDPELREKLWEEYKRYRAGL